MDAATEVTRQGETSKLSGKVWAILGIVLVADIMDLLDSTITTIAAPTISARLHGGAELQIWAFRPWAHHCRRSRLSKQGCVRICPLVAPGRRNG
jgi:hypothetical protein